MTVTLGSSSFWSINTDLVTEYESSSITSNSSFVTDEKNFSKGHRRNQDGTSSTSYGSKNSTTPIRLSQPATNKEVLITETSFRTPLDNSTKSMSIFAWVRPTSENHTLIEELNVSTLASSPTWAATLIDMVAGKYVFRIWNCTSQTAPNTTSLNQWHHVGLTYDGSTMRGFIDGRQVVSQSGCTRSFPPGAIHYAVGSNFGTDQNPDGQFEGGLDLSGLQIYKSAVPPFNVARLSSVSTVTFKSNYSGGPSNITQTIANGTTTNLTTNSFTRDGYRFNGWDSLTGGGGNNWTNGEAVSLQGDITLFAKWVQISAALTPTFGTPTPTASGFTVQITNYDAAYTWAGTATASGSASINSSGLVTVTGVAAATLSSLTVTTTRTDYLTGTASVSGTSLATCLPNSNSSGGFTVLTFTSTTACAWTVPTGVTSIRALLVGGGGGGGAHVAGGGGGGGVVDSASTTVTPGNLYAISVGAGGSGAARSSSTSTVSTVGGDSTAFGITAFGGGGGGSWHGEATSRATGGGAASTANVISPLNTIDPAQGYAGGSAPSGTTEFSKDWGSRGYPTGGGGGAGGAGGNGGSTSGTASFSGAGGIGKISNITGSDVYYGGGGGGACGGHPDITCTVGAGGQGGGASGKVTRGATYLATVTGNSGTANTGGGGGATGGDYTQNPHSGGAGGSGIVVVRYAMATLTPTFGTPTATADGFTVQISNFNTGYTWSGTATASGSVAISGTGLVTVTGVAPGTSSTATITNTTVSYTGASATVSATSTSGSALTPAFGTPTATASGFTVQISNYSGSYTWAGTASASGTVSVSNTGLVTVTGVAANTSSTATITTTRTGYTGGSATVSATSLPICSPAANDTTTVPGYTLVKFTSTTTCNWSVPTGVTAIEILAVGGGGGAGFGGQGGGGGGGQVLESSQRISVSPNDPIRVSVGSGGAGGWNASQSPPLLFTRPTSFATWGGWGGGWWRAVKC